MSLKNLITREFPDANLPAFLWTPANSDSNNPEQEYDTAKDHYSRVKALYQKMSECNDIGEGLEEAALLVGIANALDCFRSPPTSEDSDQYLGYVLPPVKYVYLILTCFQEIWEQHFVRPVT